MKKNLQRIIILLSATIPLLASAQTGVVTLKLGDKSVAVAALQDLLIKKGSLALPAATGYFGTQTQAAVEAFQAAQDLPQTGVFTITSDLLPSFFASASAAVGSPAEMSLGTTNAHVQSLQAFLIQGGYLKLSTPTEYFGNLTLAAVKAFQAAHNLPQTGVVDTATFSAMNGK